MFVLYRVLYWSVNRKIKLWKPIGRKQPKSFRLHSRQALKSCCLCISLPLFCSLSKIPQGSQIMVSTTNLFSKWRILRQFRASRFCMPVGEHMQRVKACIFNAFVFFKNVRTNCCVHAHLPSIVSLRCSLYTSLSLHSLLMENPNSLVLSSFSVIIISSCTRYDWGRYVPAYKHTNTPNAKNAFVWKRKQ